MSWTSRVLCASVAALTLGLLAPAAPAAPPPGHTVTVPDPSGPEARTNGRLFGVDPLTGPFTCSGTSLATPSGSIVLTAGHCLLEAGRWARRLLFVPAYASGARPFGSFAATALYVPPQWQYGENDDFDIAALSVRPNAHGSLTAAVGARSWRTGLSRTGPRQIFGYPSGFADGQRLRTCAAVGLGSDPATDPLPGPPTMPARCEFAEGASGGALIAPGGYVNGVTSYSYSGHPSRLYSPYFGPAIGRFLATLP